MILSLDGGKRIGWALFTAQGNEVSRGVISHEDFFTGKTFEVIGLDSGYGNELVFQSRYAIAQLVVEGIRHNPLISQGGSQHWESQVEGAVRVLGSVTNVPVKVQQPSILPVAMIHDGYEKPVTRTGKPKHLPDQDSAWLHGRYYLRSVGLID